MHAIVLGNASPDPFNVCTNRGFSPLAGRYRILARLAWKSAKLLHDDTSSHAPTPGAHASRSYVIAELKPVPPAASNFRRSGIPSRSSIDPAWLVGRPGRSA